MLDVSEYIMFHAFVILIVLNFKKVSYMLTVERQLFKVK